MEGQYELHVLKHFVEHTFEPANGPALRPDGPRMRRAV
jgi:hypothetical protein